MEGRRGSEISGEVRVVEWRDELAGFQALVYGFISGRCEGCGRTT
jgi:hypothetical protein